MCFITKPKSFYVTNINGEREVVSLNKEERHEIYLAYGDEQGYLLDGYYCERLKKKDLDIETEAKGLGSCIYCGGTIVADAVKISYEGVVIKNRDPSWGACWDCGAI